MMFSTFFRRRIHLRISKDGTCFVAHHPEKNYPYEMTKPLPKVEEDNSLLRANNKHMITKSPNLEQLQALTYTHSRNWQEFPGREKRLKEIEYYNQKDERSGL